jgi:putative zinc finger/helix-turn-helix YgiT family protein
MRKCPVCDKGRLTTRDVESRARVGRHTFTAAVPALVCAACGETLVTFAHAKELELAIAARLSEIGAANGAAFKYMRKALGLRAADLAGLLDVTPETVSRWETDRVPLDRRALASMAALVRDARTGSTATLDHLRTLAHPPRAPREIKVRLAAMAEAVGAYEAELGPITDEELAAQARADRRSAIVVRGRGKAPRRRRPRAA